MKVTVGQNSRFTWLVAGDERIILKWVDLQPSYARRFLYIFIAYYVPRSKLDMAKRYRFRVEVPDSLVSRALALYHTIDRHNCSRYRGFRDSFNDVRAETPEQFIVQIEKITNKYVTHETLAKML